MSLESLIQKFGGVTEEYTFYNGQVTLRYDPKDHVYLLATPDGLEVQDGVTHIRYRYPTQWKLLVLGTDQE